MLGERGIRGGVTGCRVKKVANLALVDCMGERHGSAQGALSSGRVKTADGLTHKDLLDIEALRVQALERC